ncbi:hypothetical protein [Calothrix sp. PCC 6303]|uniref:hypothetical protein n=1 Tax=Calothrix sp. PCC 6303 TaxID=1170562 RepID=UPI00130EA6F3|nr:hypothetical protein [Calothrix sp. PCC 6303]
MSSTYHGDVVQIDKNCYGHVTNFIGVILTNKVGKKNKFCEIPVLGKHTGRISRLLGVGSVTFTR